MKEKLTKIGAHFACRYAARSIATPAARGEFSNGNLAVVFPSPAVVGSAGTLGCSLPSGGDAAITSCVLQRPDGERLTVEADGTVTGEGSEGYVASGRCQLDVQSLDQNADFGECTQKKLLNFMVF